MQLSVSSILNAPQNVTHHPFDEQFELPGEGETLLEPVVGRLDVTRASNQILQVTGAFHTRLRLVCDRCGNEFEFPVDFSLDEALEVTNEPPTSFEVEEAVYAQGNLDATDLIRQSLLLSLPTRHLCGCEPLPQKDDQGITDPRWAALESLTVEPQE